MSFETAFDNYSQEGQQVEKDDIHVSITPRQSTQPRETDIATSRDRDQQHHHSSSKGILNRDGDILQEDFARTPTSTHYYPDSVRTSSAELGIGSSSKYPSEVNQSSYFSTDSTWGFDYGIAAQLYYNSNSSSPFESAYPPVPSPQSLADNITTNDGKVVTDPLYNVRDRVSAHSALAPASTSLTTSLPVSTPREARPLPRPSYPDQSFAALQSQYHPPPYQPYPLRTRSSHPSDHVGYSSDSSRRSRDRQSVNSGAKTVGNTPAQSPGLFSTTYSRNRPEGDESEETRYNVPLLHPAHLQAPKEYVPYFSVLTKLCEQL